MPFLLQKKPVQIPTNDNKSILEHFGRSATGDSTISIARMTAPPGWSEPFQTPSFDEYTLVDSGKKLIEADGEQIILGEGESILIKGHTRVRYSNPFEEACTYWSICMPAFSIEEVNRES